MKELTDLTIKDLLSSNTSTNTLIINQNFALVEAAIELLQTTFAIQIQNNIFGSPSTQFYGNIVSGNTLYLPNIGNQNNTNRATIILQGSNGNIIASGLTINNDIFAGNDVVLGQSGEGGRLRLYTDKNSDTTRPPRLGDFRFVGSSFQGYAIQGETESSFTFQITGGTTGQTISASVNSTVVGSIAWQGNTVATSIALVNAILEGTNPYVTAAYSAGSITLNSFPGQASSLNGATVTITGNMSFTPSSGTLSGGINGTSGWTIFGEGGSVGPTGPTGAPFGSSGSSGLTGTSGSSGMSGTGGTSGSSGVSGTSGTSGTVGSSGSSGVDGEVGPAGFPGAAGSSGSSGVAGVSGSSGSSGVSPSLSSISSFDIKLGDPSSSGYPSWAGGFFTQWNNTTYLSGQAFDDISGVIKKLAPAQPPALNTLGSLVLSSSYSAPPTGTINVGTSGVATSNTIITDSTSTNVLLPNMSTAPGTGGGGFAKEPVRTLTAMIDNSVIGTILYSDQSITPGTTTNFQLTVVQYDYWQGVSGKSGFWPALTAEITSVMTGAAAGPHVASFSWVAGGSSLSKTFWYDNPVTPSFTSLTIDTTAPGSTYISGVPSLTTGNVINLSSSINNVVSKFYYSNPLSVACPGGQITINSVGTLSGPQTNPVAVSATGTVLTAKYTENLTLNATGYNAKGGTINNSALNIGVAYSGRTMRIDTVSNETPRLFSGGTTGSYPSSGYGTAFTSSTDLTTGGYVYELQLLNGIYGRLSGVNYSSNYPITGPDYSSDTNTSYRWVLFSLSVVSCVAFSVTFNNATNFTANAITNATNGILIYGQVASSSTWVDCNSPYSGVGNPGSVNGDAAMITGSSTATFKRCTFGTTSRSGTLYIRIGLPYGSNMTFGNITIAQI